MKLSARSMTIIIAEVLMFIAMLIVLWLDEFIDIPYQLFGDPPTPFRLAEFIIETVTCTIMGLVLIIGTVLLLRKNERIEQFLRVCAWCRKVWLDDSWIPMEQYLEKKHTLQSTHGICSECLLKVETDITIEGEARKAKFNN
jgi:hypothetical protein